MKSAKRQREKGASDTEEPERASAKKSKTQVSVWLVGLVLPSLRASLLPLCPSGAEPAGLALRVRGRGRRGGRELGRAEHQRGAQQ